MKKPDVFLLRSFLYGVRIRDESTLCYVLPCELPQIINGTRQRQAPQKISMPERFLLVFFSQVGRRLQITNG